jgi:GntR family transcriptional regulator / MocR family aminotransferase
MEPVLDLRIDLPPKGSGSLLRTLHHQLRAAILDGRLRAGHRLPPTRGLAAQLGISRNTAMGAYDLLLGEGYLESRVGAGTFVADIRPRLDRPKVPIANSKHDRRLTSFWRKELDARPMPALPRRRYDFRAGYPDIGLFPFDVWQRLSTRASRQLSRLRSIEHEPRGRGTLREAIAKHVSFARAVACSADDVFVTTGTRQAADLVARILVTPGETKVAIEDPCYPPLRRAFVAAGARVQSVPVDADGLVVERIPAGTRIVCVSPSHQFPLGVTMSTRRRKSLLEFAAPSGAVIIEDDYDGEFRLEGRPVDALQTLDQVGCVFYVGTFSKSMFTDVRAGFIVAPSWARRALVAAKQTFDGNNPVLVQDTLAAFIAEGHLARHVRKMRKIYGERHAALLQAMGRHCAGRLMPIHSVAGVHLAATMPTAVRAANIAAEAAGAGITVETLDRYAYRRDAPEGLLFGYGMIEIADIEPAIRMLGRMLR